jgi:hypothetical protein
LTDNSFSNVRLFADCPARQHGLKDKIISLIKKAAVGLHLVPKTMKGKELLKRVFIGKLTPLPGEIDDGMSKYYPPVSIAADALNKDYKVIYALGYK